MIDIDRLSGHPHIVALALECASTVAALADWPDAVRVLSATTDADLEALSVATGEDADGEPVQIAARRALEAAVLVRRASQRSPHRGRWARVAFEQALAAQRLAQPFDAGIERRMEATARRILGEADPIPAVSRWVPLPIATTAMLGGSSSLSCVLADQPIMLADGTAVSTADALVRFERGERVALAASPAKACGIVGGGTQRAVATMIAACRTTAPAVEVVYSDGRRVRLTVGHCLPDNAGFARPISGQAPSRYIDLDGYPVDVGESPALVVGARMGDGTIAEIVPLGEQQAVRIWTDGPEWILTPCGLRIGTRWHEVCAAFAEVREFGPEFWTDRCTDQHPDEVLVEAEEYATFGVLVGVAILRDGIRIPTRNIASVFMPHQRAYTGASRLYGAEAYRICDDHTDVTAHEATVARQAFRLGAALPQSVRWFVADPVSHFRDTLGVLPERLAYRDTPAVRVDSPAQRASARAA